MAIQHFLDAVVMEYMVFAAFELYDFVWALEVVETNGALCGLLEQYVAEREVFETPDDFSVHLPALRPRD